MTLPYRQERALWRADRALCQSDPHLASMLSIFARINAADRMPAWEQLRPKLALALNLLLWPAAAAVFVVIFVGGGGSRAATACTVAVHRCALRWCLNPRSRAVSWSAGPGPAKSH
jgi:hypothetical protein